MCDWTTKGPYVVQTSSSLTSGVMFSISYIGITNTEYAIKIARDSVCKQKTVSLIDVS
jgi:hypothetical protein